jgi:histidine triad (HIT) family protein
MNGTCLFCRIVKGEIPATVVAESPNCLAFRDISPKAPVHCLIIPRKHLESLNAADDAALTGEIFLLAARVAREQGVADSGYRVVSNVNADGGQTVSHLHVHLLGGREMHWPPG